MITDCCNNNRGSQKKLYTLFYDYAIGICMRYAKNHDDAVEIMNDGFLKIYKELKRFEFQLSNPIAGFKAWMKKIMIFTAIDHYRKNHKHQHNELEEGMLVIADNSETQLDKLTHKEIMECVQLLPPAYRTVFSLFVLDGFTHEEIAKHLGTAVGTSKSNLAKARMHLQRLLLTRQNFNRYEQRVAR